MNPQARYQRSPNIYQRRLGGESLLVPVKGNLADMQKAFSLNASGDVLWAALAQPCSREDLRGELVAAFQVDEETADRDVTIFLDHLLERGLVEHLK